MCKKAFCGFLFIALFLLFTTVPAVAQKGKVRPTVWDVYPAMDRLQIQNVVTNASNGDTIYFHAGTYDWSDAPPLPQYTNEGDINIIDKTLTILGEPGNIITGPDSPIIGDTMYGIHAFQVLDEDTDNDVTFVGLNIQHFMRGIAAYRTLVIIPKVEEISFLNARNITIKNCTISDIARQVIAIEDPTGNVSIENNVLSQAGRGCIWFTYRGPDYEYWQPDKSSVNISGNTISACPDWGLYAERTKNFRVENNTITTLGPATDGTFGIAFWGAKKGTVISANSISNYRFGIAGEGGYSPPNSAGSENMIIDKNKISCVYPVNGWCYGIILDYDLSSGHMVTRNEINLTSTGGVGIYSEANYSIYGQNKISGSGWVAVCLSGYDYSNGTGLPTYAHHELFQGNDVSQFTPSEAHFYLDYGTHDNKVIGFGRSPWTYEDYGINNLIIGGTNLTSATVQALSAVSGVRPKPGEGLREARKNIIF